MQTNAARAGYRAILRLYPRRFQDQFAEDMLRDFMDASIDASVNAGWGCWFAHVSRAYADAIISLVREWGRERTAMIGMISVVATAVVFTIPFLPPVPNATRPPARPLSVDELSLVLFILGMLALIALVTVLGSRLVSGRMNTKSLLGSLLCCALCPSASAGQPADHASPQVPVSSYVAVDGGRVFYEAAGQGQALVFIHDGVLHREVWDAQFPELAQQFRVVRWDRRGFGRSSNATAPYSDLDDLAAIMQTLELERAVLVGSSVGSFIAVQFALDRPSMVSALVLVGPTISGLTPSEHFITRGNRGQPPPQAPFEARVDYWAATDPWILAPENKAARERMRTLLLANPAGPANGRQFARFAPQPALPRLSEIKVPTLIVAGEYDMPDVHAWAGAIQAGIAGSRRVVLAGSGHLPQFETPAAFNAELIKFAQLPK